MYYGYRSDNTLSYEYEPKKYVTVDTILGSEIWGVNTITCQGQATLGDQWTVFGTLALYDGYASGSDVTMRNYNGMADYIFFLTENDFTIKAFGWGPAW